MASRKPLVILQASGGELPVGDDLLLYSLGASGLRFSNGTYGVAHYMDGSAYYLLLTAAGSPLSSAWTGARPFYVNLSSGLVTLGAGAAVVGGLAVDAASISGPGTADRLVNFQTSGVNRFRIGLVNGADDAGIYRYADNGGYLGLPFYVERATGLTRMQSGAAVANGLTTDISTVTSNGQARRLFVSAALPADQKISDTLTDGTGWLFRFLNDAQTAANTWLAVVRSGYTAASITLAATNINLNGTTTLNTPLGVASGGTGGTTQATARAALGAAASDNPAFTGNTFSFGLASTGPACGEEIGSLTTAQTVYRDWHSSGFQNDYDVREAAAGGVNGTAGRGNYSIVCASYTIYGCGPVINVGVDLVAKRIVSGNYGVVEYCDGAELYLLVTNSGQQLTTNYSGIRPFHVNLASGLVSMDNGIAPSDINMAGSGNLAGAWNSFQATVAASTGAITTAAATVRWKKFGRTVFFNLYATVANNGSGAGALSVSLPFANNGSSPLMLLTRDLNSLAVISGYIGTGAANIAINRVSDNAYPIAANGSAGFAFSGVYEAAA